MNRATRSPRRVLALLMATLMTSLGVLVPLLDSGERPDGPVLEAEHHSGECLRGHDHTICTQIGANRALPAPGDERLLPARDLLPLRGLVASDLPRRGERTPTLPRAPPRI